MPRDATSSAVAADLLFSSFLGLSLGHGSAVGAFAHVIFPEQRPPWCPS